jgi:hypothetical protein
VIAPWLVHNLSTVGPGGGRALFQAKMIELVQSAPSEIKVGWNKQMDVAIGCYMNVSREIVLVSFGLRPIFTAALPRNIVYGKLVGFCAVICISRRIERETARAA